MSSTHGTSWLETTLLRVLVVLFWNTEHVLFNYVNVKQECLLFQTLTIINLKQISLRNLTEELFAYFSFKDIQIKSTNIVYNFAIDIYITWIQNHHYHQILMYCPFNRFVLIQVTIVAISNTLETGVATTE